MTTHTRVIDPSGNPFPAAGPTHTPPVTRLTHRFSVAGPAEPVDRHEPRKESR
jgi:hypothetical protein